MKKRIQFQGMLMFFAIVLLLVLSSAIFPRWKQESLDEFLDVFGIVVILSGFLFRITARGYKAEISGDGGSLITDGPYVLTRNPMYFGTFLIGTGIILVLFVWWAFLIFLAIFGFISTIQIHKEEEFLLNRFGDEYKRYSSITPKYFPRLASLFSNDTRNYIFLRPRWAIRELPSLIVVIVAVIIIETWQDARLFGCSEFLKEPLELFLIVLIFITLTLLCIRKKG